MFRPDPAVDVPVLVVSRCITTVAQLTAGVEQAVGHGGRMPLQI